MLVLTDIFRLVHKVNSKIFQMRQSNELTSTGRIVFTITTTENKRPDSNITAYVILPQKTRPKSVESKTALYGQLREGPNCTFYDLKPFVLWTLL